MRRIEIQPEEVMTVAGHIYAYGGELKKMEREIEGLFRDCISPELRNQVKGQFEAVTSRLHNVGNTFECLGARTKEMANSLLQIEQAVVSHSELHETKTFTGGDLATRSNSPHADASSSPSGMTHDPGILTSNPDVQKSATFDGGIPGTGYSDSAPGPGSFSTETTCGELQPINPERPSTGTPGEYTSHAVEPILQAVPPPLPPPETAMPMGAPISHDPHSLAKVLDAASQKYDIPPDILKAVAWQESTWNPLARSFDEEHGKGVMQIDDRFHEFAKTRDVWDPVKNIDYGARYLSDLYRETGSWEGALKRYNGGDDYPPKVLGLSQQQPWKNI